MHLIRCTSLWIGFILLGERTRIEDTLETTSTTLMTWPIICTSCTLIVLPIRLIFSNKANIQFTGLSLLTFSAFLCPSFSSSIRLSLKLRRMNLRRLISFTGMPSRLWSNNLQISSISCLSSFCSSLTYFINLSNSILD